MLDSQVKIVRVDGKQAVQLLYDGVVVGSVPISFASPAIPDQSAMTIYRALWRDSERVVEKLRARNRGLREELEAEEKRRR